MLVVSWLWLLTFNSGDGGIAWYSPYVLISVVIFFGLVLLGRFYLGYSKIFWIILYALSSLFTVLYGNNDELFLLRSLILFFALESAKYLSNISRNFVKKIIIFLFCELLIRFVLYAPSIGSLYSFKQTVIFPDTNFLGLVIAPIFLFYPLKKWEKVCLLLFLVLSMSRTAWIGVIATEVFMRLPFRKMLILVIPLLLVVVSLEFEEKFRLLDGSLSTKMDILLGMVHALNFDFTALLWGFGKTNSEIYLSNILGDNVHTGHTIPGNVLQYGLVYVIVSLIFFLHYIEVQKFKIPFLFFVVMVGMTGLYPFSYFPMLVYIMNNLKIYDLNSNSSLQ